MVERLFDFFFVKMSTKFSILILTIGIPGAGKTLWTKLYRETHPLCFIISTDEIRKEITGNEQCVDPKQNDMIHDIARSRVKAILENNSYYGGSYGFGPEIIVDSTNVDVEEWIKYKDLGASVLCAHIFEITPALAFKRQNTRERQVPFNIIKWKWETLQKNIKYLPKIFNFINIHQITD